MTGTYVMGSVAAALFLGGALHWFVSAQAGPLGGGVDPWGPALVVMGAVLGVAAWIGAPPRPPAKRDTDR